jgi:protocatechuate 3,4-dioxygenase beta subunit
LYIYQTNDEGWYSDRAAHVGGVEGDRKHARLFGYLKTDGEGRFEVRTIRPSGYPDSNLPAHLHVEVEPANKPGGSLITEIQFDDDPRLTAEWRKRSQKEGFVIAKVRTDSENRQRVEVELKMR